MIAEKECRRCGEVKPIDGFPFRDGKPLARCRECLAEVRREYRKNNRSTIRDNHLRYTYGLTLAEYDAMLASQGGACAICGSTDPGNNKTSGHQNSMAVDHDHVTGRVRGLLCIDCNKAIGLFRDDPAIMQKAIMYLRRYL